MLQRMIAADPAAILGERLMPPMRAMLERVSLAPGPARLRARAIAEHQRGRHFDALRSWKVAGEWGDAEACYQVGLLYARGEGVMRSVPDAVVWYRRAAEAGHAEAQYQLGLICLRGAELPPASNASYWHQVASGRDAELARQTLSALFPHGLAVEKDLDQAMHWMGAAAKSGVAEAQAMLGEMYRWGRGCPADYAQARIWYAAAAEKGIVGAEFGLGDIYYQGLGVDLDPTTAAQWYERAAAKGDARAQLALASMLRAGEGVPQDRERATDLFLKAAEQGELRALYRVAQNVSHWRRRAGEPRPGGNLPAQGGAAGSSAVDPELGRILYAGQRRRA